MCGYGPGDDIQCVAVDFLSSSVVSKGSAYRCAELIDHGHHEACITCGSTASLEVRLVGVRAPKGVHLCSCGFRKVERRDLQSWLKTSVPNTDHLDKPLPAKKRERVE